MLNLTKLEKITTRNDHKRNEIKYILINKDYVVATDAFILAEIKHGHEDIKENFFITKDEAKKIKKIDIAGQNGNVLTLINKVLVMSDDKNMAIQIPKRKIDYPDYKKIIPTTKPKATVILNATFLKNLLEVCEKDEQIILELREENEVVLIKNIDETKKLLIMPIRQ